MPPLVLGFLAGIGLVSLYHFTIQVPANRRLQQRLTGLQRGMEALLREQRKQRGGRRGSCPPPEGVTP